MERVLQRIPSKNKDPGVLLLTLVEEATKMFEKLALADSKKRYEKIAEQWAWILACLVMRTMRPRQGESMRNVSRNK